MNFSHFYLFSFLCPSGTLHLSKSHFPSHSHFVSDSMSLIGDFCMNIGERMFAGARKLVSGYTTKECCLSTNIIARSSSSMGGASLAPSLSTIKY